MTPTGLNNLNLHRSARWDDKRAFSTYCRGQQTLKQVPGSVCTTAASGGIIENRAARWRANAVVAEKPNHDSDALRSTRTRLYHRLLNHVFMHHLDARRPQGCRHRGEKSTFPLQRASPCKVRRVAVTSADAVGRAQLITRGKLKMLLESRWLKCFSMLNAGTLM